VRVLQRQAFNPYRVPHVSEASYNVGIWAGWGVCLNPPGDRGAADGHTLYLVQ